MTGDEALHELVADPRTGRIPVVVAGADAMARSARRLISRGARAYPSRPLELERFEAVVGRSPRGRTSRAPSAAFTP